MSTDRNLSSRFRSSIELCKYFAKKETAIAGLSFALLHTVGGPTLMVPLLCYYGVYSYTNFQKEQREKKEQAAFQYALHTLDVDFFKKLGIESTHQLGEDKDHFLERAIQFKNKTVIQWVAESEHAADTFLNFYNQFSAIFLDHLPSCSNSRKRLVLLHIISSKDPEHIHDMIAINPNLERDILEIASHRYMNDKRTLCILMKRYESIFKQLNYPPEIFFHEMKQDDLDYLIKTAPEFFVYKMADYLLLHKKFSKIDRQQYIDLFSKYGFDFSMRSNSENSPPNVEHPTYRVSLSYFNVVIANDSQFTAIRNQKMLALAFGISGTSQVQQEEIGHVSLADPELYWDHLTSLYYKNKEMEKKHIDPQTFSHFDLTISRLPIEHFKIKHDTILGIFNQGMPIVLPVYLSTGYGDAHIATVGFLKLKDSEYLRIEADKGMGRKEFCVYRVDGQLHHELHEYTHSRHKQYNAYRWAEARSSKETKLLSKPLSKQKDDFCPRISAEYAFQIAFFLSELKSRLDNGNSLSSLKEMNYSFARAWFKHFKLRYQQDILETYGLQDITYQNARFFSTAKERFEKHKKNLKLSSPRLYY